MLQTFIDNSQITNNSGLMDPDNAKNLIKNQVTEDLVLETLVECQGNVKLAAERICRKLELPYTLKEDIVKRIPTLIGSRLPELKQHMQAVAALELFSMLPILNKTLVENLTQLEPSDAVNAYMKLMDLIGKATDPHELTVDHRWTQVPRDLQQLYVELEASGQLEQVIAGDVT